MKKKKKRAKKKRKKEKRLQKMEEARQALLDYQGAVESMVGGYAAPMATATTMLSQAHSTGLMFENSVNQQGNGFISQQAQTAQGVIKLYNQNKLKQEMDFVVAEESED